MSRVIVGVVAACLILPPLAVAWFQHRLARNEARLWPDECDVTGRPLTAGEMATFRSITRPVEREMPEWSEQ